MIYAGAPMYRADQKLALAKLGKVLTHPGIAEVAVLGVPDAKWGEIGVAVVVRRANTPAVDEAGVLAHLEGRCARYRWPRQVFFWDALPKSGYGKITKKDVRRTLVERGELRDAPAG